MEECERMFPHYLVYCQPNWVLVGFVRSKKTFDAISISRIREISLTTQTFQRDNGFSLEEFFLSRWRMKGGMETTVRVRFTGAAANIILSQNHHPKEEVVKVDGGEVLYTLTVCGTEEIMRWILGFGSDAEVLAPKSLREQIKQHIKCLAGIYRNNPKLTRRQPGT
jgi:predicted DNA-binding transcriptional regulator YafY